MSWRSLRCFRSAVGQLRSPDVRPGSRLCLHERTSSLRPVRSEKCHEATLNPPFQHPLREPIKWKRALTGWSAIKKVAPTEWARPFLGFARIRSANEAVDYFSLI